MVTGLYSLDNKVMESENFQFIGVWRDRNHRLLGSRSSLCVDEGIWLCLA